MIQYKLRKSLPNCEAGIVENVSNGNVCFGGIHFNTEFINRFPDWFEKIDYGMLQEQLNEKIVYGRYDAFKIIETYIIPIVAQAWYNGRDWAIKGNTDRHEIKNTIKQILNNEFDSTYKY